MPNVGNYSSIQTHWIKRTYLSKYDVVSCSNIKTVISSYEPSLLERIDLKAMGSTVKYISSTCELGKQGKLAVITRGILIERQLFILTLNHLSSFEQLYRFKIKAFRGRFQKNSNSDVEEGATANSRSGS